VIRYFPHPSGDLSDLTRAQEFHTQGFQGIGDSGSLVRSASHPNVRNPWGYGMYLGADRAYVGGGRCVSFEQVLIALAVDPASLMVPHSHREGVIYE
jgi:hypothetical protein